MIVIRVVFRMLLDGAVRRPRPLHAARGPAARRGRRHPPRRRRCPPRGMLAALYDGLRLADPAPLRRRRQRARQPEAAAQGDAGRAARDRRGRHRRAQRRPAAHRERPAGAPRPAPPRGARPPLPRRPRDRAPGDDRRPRPVARCSPPPWTRAGTAAPRPCPRRTRAATGGTAARRAGRHRASAPTGCSTAPPRATSGCRCCSAGVAARLGRRGARAAAGSPRSRYRPDPWRLAEWGVSPRRRRSWRRSSSAVSIVDPTALHPSLQPAAVAAAARSCPPPRSCSALLPAWLAPPVRLPASAGRRSSRAPQEQAA